MKVRCFTHKYPSSLESEVNVFLQTVSNVIDIKFSTDENYLNVLIIYDEKQAAT